MFTKSVILLQDTAPYNSYNLTRTIQLSYRLGTKQLLSFEDKNLPFEINEELKDGVISTTEQLAGYSHIIF